MAIVDAANGEYVAEYEYGPFGELLRATGSMAGENPFGYSTKYTDAESGLLYYGYRYYVPETGRWLNRDPIEEDGGVNVYGFVGNDGVNAVDYLGWAAYMVYRPLNIRVLRQTSPLTGHVYLVFNNDFENEEDRALWEAAIKLLGFPPMEPLSFSFHPVSVEAREGDIRPWWGKSLDPSAGTSQNNRFFTFITIGSQVVVNDTESDLQPFGDKKTDSRLITKDICEQIRFLGIVVMSTAMNNTGIPDPADYSFAYSNCANWARLMVQRAGLRVPAGAHWNLGVGLGNNPPSLLGAGLTKIGNRSYHIIDFLQKRDSSTKRSWPSKQIPLT